MDISFNPICEITVSQDIILEVLFSMQDVMVSISALCDIARTARAKGKAGEGACGESGFVLYTKGGQGRYRPGTKPQIRGS